MNRVVRYFLLACCLSSSVSLPVDGQEIEGAQTSSQDTVAYEERAIQAYKRADYAEAIRQYERLLEQKPTSTVYYNLGVLYHQAERPVDALVAYERALLIEPTLQPARHNLRLLYLAGRDGLSDGRGFEVVDDLVYSLSLSSWQCVAYGLFALTLILLMVFWYYRRLGHLTRNRILFYAAVGAFILWLVTLAIIAHQIYYQAQGRSRAIIKTKLELRDAPAGQGNPVLTLHEGAPVFIEKQGEGGYVRIKLADGRRGWVPAVGLLPVVPEVTEVE